MRLEVRNGSFSYPKGPDIFRNLDFVLNEQKILTVLGQNGIGKTTLLKCVSSLNAVR